MGEVSEGDFYEEDEPIEDIKAAWERSTEHGVTGRPWRVIVGPLTFSGAEIIAFEYAPYVAREAQS